VQRLPAGAAVGGEPAVSALVPVCTVHRAQLAPEDGGFMRCPKGGPTGHLLSKRDGWSNVPAAHVGKAVPPPSEPVPAKSTARERTLRGQAKNPPPHAAKRLSAGDPAKPARVQPLSRDEVRELEQLADELAGDVTPVVQDEAEAPENTGAPEVDETGDVTPGSPGRIATCRGCGLPFDVQNKVGPAPWRCLACRGGKPQPKPKSEQTPEPAAAAVADCDPAAGPIRRDGSYLAVRLTPQARAYLQALQQTGLYGLYESEVAGRLIERALLELLAAGRLEEIRV
jgi:hypothetical protein